MNLWPMSEAARAYTDAMNDQTRHQDACPPCVRVPSCDEGIRLRAASREAYHVWAEARYAPTQTLDDLDDCINGERAHVAGRLHQDVTDVRMMPVGGGRR